MCKTGKATRNAKFGREATMRQSVGKGREGIREGLGEKCNVLFLSRVGYTSV